MGFGGERRSKEVNGAFRPKGGNGVHGLFDDAGNVSLADKGVLYECVQKIHPPPVDRTVENGYNKDARGAAGRRLTPALVREVTARLGSGGYFFFAT